MSSMMQDHQAEDQQLTKDEVDLCLTFAEYIQNQINLKTVISVNGNWLPSDHYTDMWLIAKHKKNDKNTRILKCMVEWLKIKRTYTTNYNLPGYPDFVKSRLFWRLRTGKPALKYPPPTAYSCPWYELIDEPERAHWAYELWVHKEDSTLWGSDSALCSIAQCMYKVETWSDTEETIPFSVSFGPYVFLVFKAPNEFLSFMNGVSSKTTVDGWWIQYYPNPLDINALR